MDQHLSYLPPKNEEKQLLLQQHYSITDFNTPPSQLVISAKNTEDINRQQQQTHIMQLNSLSKPKRNQVKNACVNCQKACKKCDEGRPCQRCIKYNLVETCQDSIRKERKKGVKRGPYNKQNEKTAAKKRKNNEIKEIYGELIKPPQPWPANDDVKLSESNFINNSQQKQLEQMSVPLEVDKKCEMKHVTQPISSYQKNMSKYITNLQQRQFSPVNSNTMNDNNVQFSYDSNMNTTIPSPMSNHNDSHSNMTTQVPFMPHGQEMDTMYPLYIQNNLQQQQQQHSNNVSVYGTPNGSPLIPSHQTRELETFNFVNSTPWESQLNSDHRFLNNNTDWFYS